MKRPILKLVTGTDALPFDLAEIKSHLGIEYHERDDEIEAIIHTAVSKIDDDTGRAWIDQTWDYVLPKFPLNGEIRIPIAPLQSITSVKYYDIAGTLQTLSTDNYYVTAPSVTDQGWIQAVNFIFPIAQIYRPDAVTVRFVAGNTQEIEPTYIHLVKLWCGALWANKEGQQPKDMMAIQNLTWQLTQKGYC